jgi:hypothetical protein
MKKEFGGLGVLNLRELNLCLLGSWVRRYIVDKNKIWEMLVAISIVLKSPISLLISLRGLLIFGKVSYGLPMLLG